MPPGGARESVALDSASEEAQPGQGEAVGEADADAAASDGMGGGDGGGDTLDGDADPLGLGERVSLGDAVALAEPVGVWEGEGDTQRLADELWLDVPLRVAPWLALPEGVALVEAV